MKRAALTLIAILAAPAWLVAQTQVDERRDAAPDGVVEIENLAGSVKVVGWTEAAIRVTGTLAAGAELDFEASGKRAHIEVEVDNDNPMESASDLEVHLPSQSLALVGQVVRTQRLEDGGFHAGVRFARLPRDVRVVLDQHLRTLEPPPLV